MAMQKIDNLRQDIRKSEKMRREMETQIDEGKAEASKERRLRERSEEYCKQMEEEMNRFRHRRSIDSVSDPILSEQSNEIAGYVYLVTNHSEPQLTN